MTCTTGIWILYCTFYEYYIYTIIQVYNIDLGKYLCLLAGGTCIYGIVYLQYNTLTSVLYKQAITNIAYMLVG